MTDVAKETSYSLFEKDVFIYLLKGSIAGFILSASTYGAHLITQYSNETKANAELSKAKVKVEHYEYLKALAEESESDGNTELLKEFNEKHELAYKISLNDVEVAQTAIDHPSKVLELVGSVTRLIALISYFGMVSCCGFLIWNSRELNQNTQSFTIKNGEIELLKNMLGKEIKTVEKNKKISNKIIRPHQELLKKLPESTNTKTSSKKNLAAVVLGVVCIVFVTYVSIQLFLIRE